MITSEAASHGRARDSVVVTGAAGFLGTALSKRLALENCDVIGVDKAWSAREPPLSGRQEGDEARVTRVTLNVTNRAVASLIADTRPDVIFHLAGCAYAAQSVTKPQSDFAGNLVATVGFLENIRRAGFHGLLVLASSAAVYGEPETVPVTECTPVAPISPYGASKAGCESYARMYAELFGFRVLSARLFSLYGPGQRKQVVFDTIVKASAPSSRVELLGDGSELRDFLYVEDAASALVHLGRHRAVLPGSINVCSGTSVSVSDLAGTILDLVRGDRKALAFSGVRRVGDPVRWVCRPVALEATGFRAATSLDVGLARTVDWYRTSLGAASATDA